ncbi:hypothetical protein ASZ90_010272 [hydrocarbon metagenome]|uniref:Uncharacterized protein n=1 Tax=hydrocarbon metagenome TaxID=938273 RepID=A0A0W8FI71_9ZZZZ
MNGQKMERRDELREEELYGVDVDHRVVCQYCHAGIGCRSYRDIAVFTQ